MSVRVWMFCLVLATAAVPPLLGAAIPGAPDPDAFRRWRNTLRSESVLPTLVYGQGKWVGAGDGIFYSTDGVDWTRSSFAEYFHNAIYAEGVFVVVGQAFWSVEVSTNGIDWRGVFGGQTTLPMFWGAAYGNGLFVVGGPSNPSFLVGTNPPTWWLPNHVPFWPATQQFACYGLFFGNGKFVATGPARTALSTNGYDWAVTQHPNLGNTLLRDGVYHNGRYIVVGDNGTVLVSEDATNWTQRLTSTTRELRRVAAHNNQYVTVGQDVMLISTNGLDWVEIPALGPDVFFTDVIVANNSFAAAYFTPSTTSPSYVYQSDPLNCIAPLFVKEPVSIEQKLGLSMTLTSAAEGTSPLNYQWQRNGVNIPGATSNQLNFAKLERSDDAKYRVIARNSLGETPSAEAVLTVGLPVSVLVSPVSQSVPEGGSATFSIAVEGTLPITNKWRKPGPTFVTQILNQATAFLQVDNIQSANAGVYGASLQNKYGVTASRPANLTVVADTDADGLPDDWETQYGLSDPAEDSDGDGLSNLQEYQAGTDPRDATSYLKVDRVELPLGAPAVILTFLARSNHTYSVQSRDQLGSGEWQRAVDTIASPFDRVVSVTNTIASNAAYFRLVTPRAD